MSNYETVLRALGGHCWIATYNGVIKIASSMTAKEPHAALKWRTKLRQQGNAPNHSLGSSGPPTYKIKDSCSLIACYYVEQSRQPYRTSPLTNRSQSLDGKLGPVMPRGLRTVRHPACGPLSSHVCHFPLTLAWPPDVAIKSGLLPNLSPRLPPNL